MANGLEEIEEDDGDVEPTGKGIELEEARASWNGLHELLCSSKPELSEEEKLEVAKHIGICIAYLTDVKGISSVRPRPEGTEEELLHGVYIGELSDLLATGDELIEEEDLYDRTYCDLTLAHIKLRFNFEKKTENDQTMLDYKVELMYPRAGFYRGAWEEMQAKFAQLTGEQAE